MTRRKRPGEYVPGNVDAHGGYIVGRNRPPEGGKFKAGAGRKRGRRKRGTHNLATDLRDELDSTLTVTMGGVQKRMSRQRAIVTRLADNACRGQNAAIDLVLRYQQRLVEPLLARGMQPLGPQDLECLSVFELQVLLFLTKKIEGQPNAEADLFDLVEGERLSRSE